MEQNNKNRKIVLGVMLVSAVIMMLAGTFAYFVSQTQITEEKLTVTTGKLALTFADNNTGITASEIALGDSTTKEFSIKNTGTLPAKTNMLWNNLINTYLKESMSYTLQYKTSEADNWETTLLASGNIPRSSIPQDFTLAENITIPVGATYYYKLTITFNNLSDVDQTIDISAKLASSFKLGDAITLSDADKTRVVLGKKVNSVVPNFNNIAITNETADGLYAMADDYGASYYYRGAVTDNYVKFGKWAEGTDNAGKDMYWRIIRINGDGSIRMIYDGTSAHANGEDNTDRFTHIDKAFNTNYDDNAYVGWMYGTPGGTKEEAQTNTTNSPMKDLVNTWYDANLASYDQYIADSVYCADRSIPGKSVTGWADDTGLGIGTNATGYGALARTVDVSTGSWLPRTNPTPQFTCPQKNDAFTVSDRIYGNAIGTEKSRKIGLITADEIVTAGGRFYKNDGSSDNTSFYLYKGSFYWSLSPFSMNPTSNVGVMAIWSNGHLNAPGVTTGNVAVAPVISIKANYANTMTGTGTAGDPYVIPGVA